MKTHSDYSDGKLKYLQKSLNRKPHLMYHKADNQTGTIEETQPLGLNRPALNDLSLTSCTILHPERPLLQCPSLESVHASGCKETLVGAFQSRVHNDIAALDDHFPQASGRWFQEGPTSKFC